MYQLSFGTDELDQLGQPKISTFRLIRKLRSFDGLYFYIQEMLSKMIILKWSVNDIVLGYTVRLPFNGLGGLPAPVKVGQF